MADFDWFKMIILSDECVECGQRHRDQQRSKIIDKTKTQLSEILFPSNDKTFNILSTTNFILLFLLPI